MSIRTKKLIEVLAQISNDRNLQVTISESLKGGLITGASALIGGILLGPVGLAIGGSVGGAQFAMSSLCLVIVCGGWSI